MAAGSARTTAKTVAGYLASLPAERREVLSAVRDVVNANLPAGYTETMTYGMIGWGVPLSILPETYNGQPLMYAGVAAQKTGYSLHLVSVYGDAGELAKLQQGFRAAGKRLDMGKACVRFKRIEDLAIDVIAEIIADVPMATYIERYHAARRNTAAGRKAAAKASATKKPAPSSAVVKKKTARTKTAAKRPAKRAR
jgi:hypothetical protein